MKRRLWKKLLLIPIGLLISLLVVEFGLRIAGFSYPLPYATDHYCASRLRPGFSGWFTSEGSCFVRVNRHGNRDRERSIAKPAGVLRIAVLGDSFAEARQVPIADTFWSVLEQELALRLERKVEVLNFGVSGYSTVQELQMLRNHVWQFEPDIVLLTFTAVNDIQNNSKQLEGDQVKPFYVLRNGKMELDTSFRQHPLYLKCQTNWVKFKAGMINRSRLLQVVSETRSRNAQVAAPARGTFLKPPRKPAWRQAWDLTERVLLLMRDNVRSHNAQFWIVTLSSDIQVDPDAKVRDEFTRRNKIADIFYPDKRIKAFARKHKIDSIMLAADMQRYAQTEGVYLHGFKNTRPGRGHWNKAGHRVAGELIGKAMANGGRNK